MKNLYIFILMIVQTSFAYSQNDSLLRGDTTWFVGGKGYVGIQIMLTKNPPTFHYTFRDCMLTHITKGSYSISDDSIHLKCETDCEILKNSHFVPMVIEDDLYGHKEPRFIFISTDEDTLENFKARIIYDTTSILPCNKLIEIKIGDSLVSIKKVRDCRASYFIIRIPVDMLYPNIVSFIEKSAKIENNNLILDGRKLKYIPLRVPQSKLTKGKRKTK